MIAGALGLLVYFGSAEATMAVEGAQQAESSATPATTATGTPGPPGPPGPEGKEGKEGKEGPRGPAGPSGARGPEGSEGSEGPQGVSGPAGPAGPSGPEGEEGEKGAKGRRGRTGPAGEKGERGERGSPGNEGKAGKTFLFIAEPQRSASELAFDTPHEPSATSATFVVASVNWRRDNAPSKIEVFVEGVKVGMAFVKPARSSQAEWTIGFLVPAGGHYEVKRTGARATVHLHASYSPFSRFVRSENDGWTEGRLDRLADASGESRGIAPADDGDPSPEHGIAPAGSSRDSVRAPSVNSASTILVSLEGKVAGTVRVTERTAGVGFVVQDDAPADNVDWAVID